MAKPLAFILVIDDYPLNLEMLSHRLHLAGYKVATAASGEIGLAFLRDHADVDLVLLDILMPEMDGYQVLKKIRTELQRRDLPVIMATAVEQQEGINKALEMGADDYLTKPINFSVGLARIRNLLAQRKAEQALRESEQRYALAAEAANDGLWDWNMRSGKVFYSATWRAMLGLADADLAPTADTWFSLIHPDDLEGFKHHLNQHLEKKTPIFQSDYRIRHHEGHYLWCSVRGRAIRPNEHSSPATRLIGWQTDTQQRIAYDHLTSLPMRGLFMERLSWELENLMGDGGRQLVLLYLGMDRLNVINVQYGWETGDFLLQAVVERISAVLPESATFGRLVGDQFAILIPVSSSLGASSSIAQTVQSVMRTPLTLPSGKRSHLSFCMGLCILSDASVDPKRALSFAQSAFKRAKQLGPGSSFVFQATLTEQMTSQLLIENQLRTALQDKEFQLYFQPQFGKDGGLIGAEALIRWHSAELGSISPTIFIPVAEASGLILPIGEWVLVHACGQLQHWLAKGFPTIRMSVNLSLRQFAGDFDLMASVDRALSSTGLAPEMLELELTETAILENEQETMAMLQRLRERGVHLALDDFGTGYSSLSYLTRMPLDTLKIDRSFVEPIAEGRQARSICASIIDMAHSLNLEVIAEGVETSGQADVLKAIGCDVFQGFLYGRPIAATDFERHYF